jgi:hypothetical protein
MQVARVAPDWPVPSLMHRRRVWGDRTTYVGLDVHKDGIVVALAEGGLWGEVRDYGRIANTPAALQRLVRKLGQEGVRLRFCYEAGPCVNASCRQPRQTGRIPPIRLDPVARPLRDQRWRHYNAFVPVCRARYRRFESISLRRNNGF